MIVVFRKKITWLFIPSEKNNETKFRYVSVTLSLISLTSLVINYGFEPFFIYEKLKSC